MQMRLSGAVDGFLLFKSVRCSKNTIRDYRNSLTQWTTFLGDPWLWEVEGHDVQRFLYWLRVERELRPKTVKNAHTGISSFFSWAVDEGLVDVHVVRDGNVEPPQVPEVEIQPLTEGEVRLLLMALGHTETWETETGKRTRSNRPTMVRDRALVLVLLDAGLRVSELCGLDVGDVDLESGRVIVRADGGAKGGRGRTVFVGRAAREALWRYLAKRGQPGGDAPLFGTARYKRLDRHNVRKILRRAGERAGIGESVHPHRLRHTFAINYLRNGGDIFTLQKLLGHSSMEMVRRYLAIAEVDVAQAHRRASPVDNWGL